MDVDFMQDCANGVRNLVKEGKLEQAMSVATHLQLHGQVAILDTRAGKAKHFFSNVIPLLDTLIKKQIQSDPQLRFTVAKTARVFMQLAAHRMQDPFDETTKNELINLVGGWKEAANDRNQYGLCYELTCLHESLKGLNTGVSLFNLKLAGRVVKGAFELATGKSSDSLLDIAKEKFSGMGKLWYPDALRLSWIGQMAKNDEETFKFFRNEVDTYVDRRCKFIDFERRNVLIGIVDTFADIVWTSRFENHQQTAALWIAKLANHHQSRARLKEVRYRAVEQLVAMKEHQSESIGALATLHLSDHELTNSILGKNNTGFLKPPIVPSTAEIHRILTSAPERKVDRLQKGVDLLRAHIEIIDGKLNRMSSLLVKQRRQFNRQRRQFRWACKGLDRQIQLLNKRLKRACLKVATEQRLAHDTSVMAVRHGIESRLGNLCNCNDVAEAMSKFTLCYKHARELKERGDDLATLARRGLVATLVKKFGPTEHRLTTPSVMNRPWALAQLVAGAGTTDLFGVLGLDGEMKSTDPSDGLTPIWWALTRKREGMAQFLKEKGGDVNHRNPRGWTPLHQFLVDNDLDGVRFMIQMEANVNVWVRTRPRAGIPPVAIAALNGNFEGLKLLVDAGASINCCFKWNPGDVSDNASTYNLLDLVRGEGSYILVPSAAHWKCADLLVEKGLKPTKPRWSIQNSLVRWFPRLHPQYRLAKKFNQTD